MGEKAGREQPVPHGVLRQAARLAKHKDVVHEDTSFKHEMTHTSRRRQFVFDFARAFDGNGYYISSVLMGARPTDPLDYAYTLTLRTDGDDTPRITGYGTNDIAFSGQGACRLAALTLDTIEHDLLLPGDQGNAEHFYNEVFNILSDEQAAAMGQD